MESLSAGSGVGGGESTGNSGAATGAAGMTEQGTPNTDAVAGAEGSAFDISTISSDQVSQHPDFRNLQSTYDRRIADLERQLQSSQQGSQDRYRQYAQSVQNALGDRFDETAQRDLYLVDMEQRLAIMEQERQVLLEQQAREAQLQTLAQTYGVDVSVLDDVADPMTAYQRVADHNLSEVQRLQAELTQAQQRLGNRENAQSHTPDLGAGNATPVQVVQQDYNRAIMAGDVRGAEAIQRYAEAESVELDTRSVYQNRGQWAALLGQQ